MFGHQDRLSFYISVGYQHSKGVTKIEILSPTSQNNRQLYITNITMSPTSLSSFGDEPSRWNMSVTTLRCWWQIGTFSSQICFYIRAGHQHSSNATKLMSPTSLWTFTISYGPYVKTNIEYDEHKTKMFAKNHVIY